MQLPSEHRDIAMVHSVDRMRGLAGDGFSLYVYRSRVLAPAKVMKRIRGIAISRHRIAGLPRTYTMVAITNELVWFITGTSTPTILAFCDTVSNQSAQNTR